MNLGQNQTARMVGKNQQIRPDFSTAYLHLTCSSPFLITSLQIPVPPISGIFPSSSAEMNWTPADWTGVTIFQEEGKKKKKKTGSLRTPSEEIQTPRVTEVLIKTKKGRMLKQWEKRLLPLKFSLAWQTAEPGREVHANCHGLSFWGRHVRILSGG